MQELSMEDFLPWLLDFEEDINKSKDPKHAKIFWSKLAWEVTSCQEAAEVFPDMRICPICMERAVDGHMSHKFMGEVLN
jgi:hypothetical protein